MIFCFLIKLVSSLPPNLPLAGGEEHFRLGFPRGQHFSSGCLLALPNQMQKIRWLIQLIASSDEWVPQSWHFLSVTFLTVHRVLC